MALRRLAAVVASLVACAARAGAAEDGFDALFGNGAEVEEAPEGPPPPPSKPTVRGAPVAGQGSDGGANAAIRATQLQTIEMLTKRIAALEQQKGAGSNTLNDLDRMGACREPVQRFCAGIAPGDGRVAQCLMGALTTARAQQAASPLPASCEEELSGFFFSAARARPSQVDTGRLFAVEPVSGMRAACSADARKLCPGKVGAVLEVCLKGSKQQLAASCQGKVLELQTRQALDVGLDVPLFEACEGDLEQVAKGCSDLQQGTGGGHPCLKSRQTELSERCQAEIFRREQEEAEDIRLNLDVLAACKVEMATVCKDQAFGEARMLGCLWEKAFGSTAQDFGLNCMKKVEQLTVRSVQDLLTLDRAML